MNHILSSLVSWVLLLGVQTAIGDDWPQYRGINGDGRSAEKTGSLKWPDAGPKQLWKVETPFGFSSFSVAGGRAVTMIARDIDRQKREVCMALDASSGQELWSVPIGLAEYGSTRGERRRGRQSGW